MILLFIIEPIICKRINYIYQLLTTSIWDIGNSSCIRNFSCISIALSCKSTTLVDFQILTSSRQFSSMQDKLPKSHILVVTITAIEDWKVISDYLRSNMFFPIGKYRKEHKIRLINHFVHFKVVITLPPPSPWGKRRRDNSNTTNVYES